MARFGGTNGQWGMALIGAVLLVGGTASGQSISGLSIVKNAGNSADLDDANRDVFSAVAVTVPNVQTRYSAITLADIAVGNVTATLAADYQVSFSVTAPGAYSLQVNTNMSGGLSAVDDTIIVPYSGNCDVGAVTGSVTTGPAVATGTLSLVDPVATRSTPGNTTFGPVTASATIDGVSNGASQNHSFRFTFGMSANSSADECAAKIGISGVQGGQTVGGAPGNAATDGHFVNLVLTSFCGNGTVQGARGEQCDDGPANGTAGSCCSSACQFKPNGTGCTDDGNGCTNDECNGSSATCMHPANSAPCNDGLFCNGIDTCSGGACVSHTGDPCPGADGDGNCSESCNEAADNCLAADTDGSACTDGMFCNGVDTCSGGACAAHVGDPCLPLNTGDGNCSTSCNEAGDACNAADPNGTGCSDGLFCNGTDTCNGGACASHTGDPCGGPDGDTDCSESCDEGADNCLAADADGTSCRADTGECDVEETCLAGVCPSDAFEPSGTACGSSSDTVCDNPDTCDGSNFCQINNEPNTTECRADAGDCDVAELCDGAGACPADAFESSGTPCGDGNDTDCTNPDTCDGSGFCEDNHEPITTLCRAGSPGQECDEPEFCDGGGSCPADGVKTNGTLCRGSAGICDIVENCDGVNFDCPTDDFEPVSTSCRADAGECDLEEFCPGNGPLCPPDNFESSGTSCGSGSDTDCTNPDTCDGSGFCQDNHETSGTLCTSDGVICTVDECDGSGLCQHPAGNLGTECRAASAGQECDEAEECDGINPTCPADGVKSFGTLCRADAGECDVQEVCDGINFDCPFDMLEADGTACGDPLDSSCTNPDTCLSGACASNHEPPTTLCRAGSPGQLCDEPEFCNGAGNCPADAPKANGVECRAASAGQECDEAEECDGINFQCPGDGVLGAGTQCRAQAGGCDIAEVCNGSSSDCPADAIRPSGFTCRADSGECDVAEQCDGATKPCPADAFEPNGSSCTDDGLFCTGDEECQSGICVGDGDPCTVGTCDEGTDQCIAAGCESAPLAGCVSSLKSILVIKDKTPDTKDKLIWKWLKGTAVQGDFADPVTTADYTLCIYTAQGLVSESVVPPSGGKWSPISTKGYKYKDKPGTNFGITKVILKGNQNPNKAKALVKGKGMDLDDIPDATNSALDLDLPVKVQLVNESNGKCFEANYGMADIKKNVPGKFKAKAQ